MMAGSIRMNDGSGIVAACGVVLGLVTIGGCAGGASLERMLAERGRRIASLEAERNALRKARSRSEARVQELEARLALLRAEVTQLRSGRWRTVRLGASAEDALVRREAEPHGSRGGSAEGRARRSAVREAREARSERLVLRVHASPSAPSAPTVTEDRPTPGARAEPSFVSAPLDVSSRDAYDTSRFGSGDRAAASPRGVPRVDAALQGYRAALRSLRAGRFEEAHRLLEGLQGGALPARLREGVRYWSAEALYGMARYREALVRFEHFLAAHASSRRAPDALWKVSLCRERLGDEAGARNARRRLLERYPASVAARMAAREEDRT